MNSKNVPVLDDVEFRRKQTERVVGAIESFGEAMTASKKPMKGFTIYLFLAIILIVAIMFITSWQNIAKYQYLGKSEFLKQAAGGDRIVHRYNCTDGSTSAIFKTSEEAHDHKMLLGFDWECTFFRVENGG